MKKIFNLLPISLILGLNSFASSTGRIEEKAFVTNLSHKDLIAKHPEITIDHMDVNGFEVYGPKGMLEWFDLAKIQYSKMHEHISDKDLAAYPSFKEIESKLKEIAQINPNIVKLFSIGKSVEGRDLWVLKISDNVNVDEVEPEIKYISSMHGDEIVGRELTWMFAKDIIEAYGTDKSISELIDSTEIYIMPSMNPDGSHYKQRANANGYDLNRNFPDWKRGDQNNQSNRQIETKHLMNFQAARNFSLSANFHGGSVVVNYPWDNTYDKHPYDDLLQEISLAYSELNQPMYNSYSFDQGITNGAQWYVLSGGMQDWSYYFHNDLQVTIELSNRKWPSYYRIASFYSDNKDSLLAFLKKGTQGQGFKSSNKDAEGSVEVYQLTRGQYIKQGRFGWSHGEFYKVLPEGEYKYIIHSNKVEKVQEMIFSVSTNQSVNPYLEIKF